MYREKLFCSTRYSEEKEEYFPIEWNVISAVAGVCGAILTFISILVAIGLEQQKNIPTQNKPINKQPLNNLQLRNEAIYRQRQIFRPTDSFFDDSLENNDNDHTLQDSFAPYLYISVGLIGTCGGIASILIPWLLLQASPEWQCVLYVC